MDIVYWVDYLSFKFMLYFTFSLLFAYFCLPWLIKILYPYSPEWIQKLIKKIINEELTRNDKK